MKISIRLHSSLVSGVFMFHLLVCLSLLLPALAGAEKPEKAPDHPGLMKGAMVKQNGNRTTIMGVPHLTEPSVALPQDIALGFVRGHKDIFGLSEEHFQHVRVKKSLRSAHNHAHHVYLGQEINGHRVSGTGLTVNIDSKGRIVSIAGPLSKGIPSGSESITGSEAVWQAGQATGVQIPLPLNPLAARGTQLRWENTFAKGSDPNPITAELVWRENVS